MDSTVFFYSQNKSGNFYSVREVFYEQEENSEDKSVHNFCCVDACACPLQSSGHFKILLQICGQISSFFRTDEPLPQMLHDWADKQMDSWMNTYASARYKSIEKKKINFDTL